VLINEKDKKMVGRGGGGTEEEEGPGVQMVKKKIVMDVR